MARLVPSRAAAALLHYIDAYLPRKVALYCRKKVPAKVGVENFFFLRALGSLLLTTQRRKTTVVVYTLQTLKGGV